MKLKLILLFLLITPVSLIAQPSFKLNKNRIDDLLIHLKDSLNLPGLSAGIAVGRTIVYEKIIGVGTFNPHTKLTKESVWPICSITKQFTSAACLELIGQKKLNFQDELHALIDDLPDEFQSVSVRQLLTMTSGIKDYLNEKHLYGKSWELVKANVFSSGLNFKPGTDWSYSNTAYWLLAQIIENCTGEEFDSYLEKVFFNRLAMQHTGSLATAVGSIPLVQGYRFGKGKHFPVETDYTQFRGKGDGELYSTLGDLLKWSIALTQDQLLLDRMLIQMWTPVNLSDGTPAEVFPSSGIHYGMGWFIQQLDHKRIMWTPGSSRGFSTALLYDPDDQVTVVVLCNQNGFLMANLIGVQLIRLIRTSLDNQ